MIKRLFAWVKSFFTVDSTTEEETRTIVEEKSSKVKPVEYWSIYAAHVKAENYRYTEKHNLDDESVRLWKENNAQLDEYFKRGTIRKPRLHVVA
ncbi:hypothetical protein QO179_24930 [Bacillus stercoris]|nr:hypothetical protein [Bacillus stercoris]